MINWKIIDLFRQGHCLDAHKVFGAHFERENDVEGVRFTVYAPNAKNVMLKGNFNNFEGCWMNRLSDDGIYSVFVPGAKNYDQYLYAIETSNGNWIEKSDPYAFFSELRPSFLSKVFDIEQYTFNDEKWMSQRTKNFDRPVNIYEVHLGSWRKHNDEWYSYDQLIDELIPYCKENGFTHIEVMPLTEHPFDGSWGYQNTGYFSPTSRYGNPSQLMHFIDMCHQNDLGVIMDFVPVHFVKDAPGLCQFDGGNVYEYPNDTDRYSEWDTYNFDLWKETVRSFLMSSASYWLEYYHFDGIRIDAVSNLIYWGGNSDRGTNEGALNFIKRFNYCLNERYQGIMLIAEDSSSFPGVCASTLDGGLGFDYKWDLGWMNDTLKYLSVDPIYRYYEHHKLTFSMAYYYSEKFLLPLSHDEVVHGKGTIINKIWGSYEQKFAQLKTLYLYMMTHPGKKLNFMGNELAQFSEWNEIKSLDWNLMDYPRHNSFFRFFKDVCKMYINDTVLYKNDYDPTSFKWIDADNLTQSVYSYFREDENECYVTVLNFSNKQYDNFRIGVPYDGFYLELINTEKDIYNGCNACNFVPVKSDQIKSHGFDNSINFRICAFSGIIFKISKEIKKTEEKIEEATI